MKIIKIDGFKGLITALFMIACLFAGFVISPGVVMMYLWNKYLVNLAQFPMLDVFQGVLLWGIISVSYIIITKGRCAVSFKQAPELSDPEMNMIIKNAKIYSQMKKINNNISKSDKFDKTSDNVLPIHKDINSSKTNVINSEENENSVSNIK